VAGRAIHSQIIARRDRVIARPRRHAAGAGGDHAAAAAVPPLRLLRRQSWRGRCLGSARAVAQTALRYASAVHIFEVVNLSGHRPLPVAEALARDGHLTAETVIRIGPDAGAALSVALGRIATQRRQPESGRAGAFAVNDRSTLAGDDDRD